MLAIAVASRVRSLPAFALGLALAIPAGAGLTPDEWQHAAREAAQLAGKPLELERKAALIATVRREDSARAARLLLGLAAPAAVRREDLAPRAAKAAEDYKRIDRQLRKKHGQGVKREVLERSSEWRTRREAFDRLSETLDADAAVLAAVGEACAAFRSADAVEALADAADGDVAAARGAPEVRNGILSALLAQPGDRFDAAILAFVADPAMPHARVRILDRIGAGRLGGGFDAAVACLGAEEPLVVRAAVAALRALDDPRAVPPLVGARRRAKGLLAEEIDLLLHRFTGNRFSGIGADAMWEGWWKSEGEAWLASRPAERHEGGVGGSGGAEFYGIETRSNRIVFVLDRSYSMRLPVPRRGPVTGPARDEGAQGGTKLEVAKGKLEGTIRKLVPDVGFGVVFFGADVETWHEPPRLVPATPENRQRAIDWFQALEPRGSTSIFAALAEALRYAKVGGGKGPTDPAGADTIFLLTDGAPTVPGTEDLLLGAGLETAVQAFLDANREYRCVVHTIGVGPDHNKELMMRLARETGGTYRAVGVE